MKQNQQGSIINCSSVEGLAGMASLTAYTGTKFAVDGGVTASHTFYPGNSGKNAKR